MGTFTRRLSKISRTHHATCAFRLSCGCISEYNSFPEAKHPTVLCGNCGESATIDYRYPDDSESCHATCRADKPGRGNVRVRCSNVTGHEDMHYDASVALHFEVPGKLRAGRHGNT
jgi:hypothetical protein